MQTSARHYPIQRPAAAFCAGAAVAILGGLIGLGGAEFRLPILIAIFELYPHRAVRTNLLISLATLAASAGARLGFVHATNVTGFAFEIAGMILGGMATAWIGAGFLSRLPKHRIVPLIGIMLLTISVLLVIETVYAGTQHLRLPEDLTTLRSVAALIAGSLVGAVSSMLGVAGGELIIPIMMFVFGADIKTAGTASVLISLPVVLTGLARHVLNGLQVEEPPRLSRPANESGLARGRGHWRLSGSMGTNRRVEDRSGRDPCNIGSQVDEKIRTLKHGASQRDERRRASGHAATCHRRRPPRTPVRPNPIGTQIVRLKKAEGPILFVRGLDCLDGTPLIDLKPDRTSTHDLHHSQAAPPQVAPILLPP